MTPAQWTAVAAVALGAVSLGVAAWAGTVEADAPGWRSNLALGGAFTSVLLIGVALQLAE